MRWFHHRRRDQVVALELARHLLLVHVDGDHVDVLVGDRLDQDGSLGAEQDVERHRADDVMGRIDHEQLGEAVGQVVLLAHVVDGLADGPEGRHGDELGLHQPAGGVLRIFQATPEGNALFAGQLGQDLRLLGDLHVLQQIDRVVRFQFADRLDDLLVRHSLEDLVANGLFQFGQRGGREVVAQHLDQGVALLRRQQLDQVGEIRLSQLAGEVADMARIAAGERLLHVVYEVGTQRALLVPHLKLFDSVRHRSPPAANRDPGSRFRPSSIEIPNKRPMQAN